MPAAVAAMPVIAGVAGVASAGMSLYSGIKGGQASSDAADASTQMAQQQADIAKAQWDRYLEKYAPMEEAALTETQKPLAEQPGYQASQDTINRNFTGMMGGINRRYADTGANMRRMLGGRYPQGAGLEVNAQRSNELNRTKAVTGADLQRVNALDTNEANWNDKLWNRQYSLLGLGRGLVTNAQTGFGNAANQSYNLANMYGQQATGGMSGAGQGLSNMYQNYVIDQYLNKNKGGTSTPSYGYTANENNSSLSYDNPFPEWYTPNAF